MMEWPSSTSAPKRCNASPPSQYIHISRSLASSHLHVLTGACVSHIQLLGYSCAPQGIFRTWWIAESLRRHQRPSRGISRKRRASTTPRSGSSPLFLHGRISRPGPVARRADPVSSGGGIPRLSGDLNSSVRSSFVSDFSCRRGAPPPPRRCRAHP